MKLTGKQFSFKLNSKTLSMHIVKLAQMIIFSLKTKRLIVFVLNGNMKIKSKTFQTEIFLTKHKATICKRNQKWRTLTKKRKCQQKPQKRTIHI